MNTRILDIIFLVACLGMGIYTLIVPPVGLPQDGMIVYVVSRFFRPLAFLTVAASFLFRLLKNPRLNAISRNVSYIGIAIYVFYIVLPMS